MSNLEYEAARAMLAPLHDHFLIEPIIATDRIRFDLLDQTAYNILSSGEKAIVDLAHGFWNNAPTTLTFGECLRRLDRTDLAAFELAITIWRKHLT